MLLAAANAYIGLLVGLTVSASIPAAAASMGILRIFPRSNILENNMVQTSASAGESLVAGIIFTIPALVMMGAWEHYDYWPIFCIAIVGGFLGVMFTIPLRRALIVEAKLRYPEGIATAEVLKSGGIETNKQGEKQEENRQTASGLKILLEATGIGGAFKLAESGFGWLAGNIATTKAWFGDSYLFTGNFSLSPALISVGYIVGLNIAVLVFIGGILGTMIGVPVNWAINSETIMTMVGIDPSTPFSQLTAGQWGALAWQSWNDCRRIGVGAMIIGGIWSLVSLFKPLVAGIKASLHVYESMANDGEGLSRTEFDTPIKLVAMGVLLGIIPVFLIFYYVMGDFPNKLMIALIMTVLMVVFGFIFSSVAGYMAGLVGSSNNPISGVTIATVIISALLLVQIVGKVGPVATLGPVLVLFLAGMICSAAAIAGDNMQDLKCGHCVGSTPWRQQLYQIIGVASAAIVIPFVLQILDDGYGIGRPSPMNPSGNFLAAPQAGLMCDLATGIFGAGIQWGYIYLGYLLAVILIVIDKIQEKRDSHFRFPVLTVAIGIYLPLGLSASIFVGGLLAHLVAKRSQQANEKTREARTSKGLLIASGLITGEALMGVLIAIIAAFVMPLPATIAAGAILGSLVLVLIIYYLYKRTMSTE